MIASASAALGTLEAESDDVIGGEERPARRVVLDVAVLERAFEDTSNEARRYLDTFTGTITALHHGMTDPATFMAFERDPRQLLIEPVARRRQYRWMEEFAATVEDPGLAASLSEAVQGRGAFARFQGVLAQHPREKIAWRELRDSRLHAAITEWLSSRGIAVTGPFVMPDRSLEIGRHRLAAAAARLRPRDLTALIEVARFLVAARDMSGRPRVGAAVED